MHRHYIPRHKVKYPCMYCGHDIVHAGVEYDRCLWHWTVTWLAFWYHLGVQVRIDSQWD